MAKGAFFVVTLFPFRIAGHCGPGLVKDFDVQGSFGNGSFEEDTVKFISHYHFHLLIRQGSFLLYILFSAMPYSVSVEIMYCISGQSEEGITERYFLGHEVRNHSFVPNAGFCVGLKGFFGKHIHKHVEFGSQ